MKVTVFGTGYVGLTQAVCLAEVGHSVCCVDVNEQRIATLNEGRSPIYEPGMAALLHKGLASKRLLFTTDAVQATHYADLIFIAVGTPPQADGSADLRHVFSVVETIAAHAADAKIIVNKSTSPVGTVDRIKARLAELQSSGAQAVRFQVVSNPEFLKEGSRSTTACVPSESSSVPMTPRSSLVLSVIMWTTISPTSPMPASL